MVIYSKFTDYYDYISRTIGADPLFVYERKPLASGDGFHNVTCDLPAVVLDTIHVPRLVRSLRARPGDYESPTYHTATIVAGNYVWPMLIDEYSTRLPPIVIDSRCLSSLVALPGTPPPTKSTRKVRGTEGDYEGRYRQVIESLFGDSRGWPIKRPVLPVPPPAHDTLDPVLRAVGAPVFMLGGVTIKAPPDAGGMCPVVLHVYKRIPVLADMGIPYFVEPTQMWQEIFRVISSVLRKDPDKQPPHTVGNNDRIEAAGFDLRISFRDPTRLKDLK